MMKCNLFAVLLCLTALSAEAAGQTACCEQGWEEKALLEAEVALDGICRGSTSPNVDMRGYSCQARQAVVMALNRSGWCYGKEGQNGSEMNWHKCQKSSYRMSLDDLHSYDWDEEKQDYTDGVE